MSDDPGKVRVKKEDRSVISDMRDDPEIQELALEEGATDEIRGGTLKFETLFELIIPDDAEPMARPEEEMIWVRAGSQKSQILDLAGENVSAHEVVSRFTAEFVEGREEYEI